MGTVRRSIAPPKANTRTDFATLGLQRIAVSIVAGWAKMRARSQLHLMKSKSALNDFSAGLIFGVGSVGYFAFLLSTGAQAYEAEELSFKLVHKTFIDPFRATDHSLDESCCRTNSIS